MTTNHSTPVTYEELFDRNKAWVAKKMKEDPDFFKESGAGQQPNFLWIGCSDSRVPANEITGTNAGDIFVHRNIANMVSYTDMNLHSVLQYAVEKLEVEHVIVCGHYGCGGVEAAMDRTNVGLANNWLTGIKDVYARNAHELDAINDPKKRSRRLVELNVREQVFNLGKTSIVQKAWQKPERKLNIHGWVYDIHDGIIHDLHVLVDELEDLQQIYRFK